MPMSESASRVALIVKAGNELGRQIAMELARVGCRVALNDLLPDRIEQIAAQVRSSGGVISTNPADLTRKLSLQTMLQSILDTWERVDILIFIANVQPADALLDMDEWDWHRALDQNLTAAFLCTQSLGRVMRELGGGTIIYVLAGDQAKQSATYASAAAGLRAMSAAAAGEFEKYNIRVSVIETRENHLARIIELCGLKSSVSLTGKQ